MNNPWAVKQALEWVEQLRTLVAEATSREEWLNNDLSTRTKLARQQCQAAVDVVLRQFASERTAVEAGLQSARQRVLETYERRKARFKEAHKSAKKRALLAIEEEEGRRKYKLQMGTMQATRDRDSGLAAADKALDAYQKEREQDSKRLDHLEERANASFSGYGRWQRWLTGQGTRAEVDEAQDEQQMAEQIRALIDRVESDLQRFRSFFLPALFRFLPLWVILVLGLVPMVPVLRQFQIPFLSYRDAGIAAGALCVLGLVLHLLGRRQGDPVAREIALGCLNSRRLIELGLVKADQRRTADRERIENTYQTRVQAIEQDWTQALADAGSWRESWPARLQAKETRAFETNERLHRLHLSRHERQAAEVLGKLQGMADARQQELQAVCTEKEQRLKAEHDAQWAQLESNWKSRIPALLAEVNAQQQLSTTLFPAWDARFLAAWKPPLELSPSARLGELRVDVSTFAKGLPKDPRLAFPGPARLLAPLELVYPGQGSILFETSETGRDEAVASLNNLMLRLLSTAPPGKVNFTVFDPVGLGQNFAGVMHLADHEEHLINGRIWTQTEQLEQKLADLNAHMEKVIQMYLRNEYQTIADYNREAGNIAEKYLFLVVADFPSGFSETAVRRLMSIATSGARCGVYTLIHWDRRLPLPQDFVADDLRKASVALTVRSADLIFTGNVLPGTQVALDSGPDATLAVEFVHKMGRASRDSNRVEVPFSHVTPPDAEMWTQETTSELRVPIGRTGATKLQYLAIGKGTRQHALLAGKTGSGKSTLFHVVITNLALWCSPDQVEFYLVDFKKGVEFKCYATQKLPHARVVAIESDREFGLSVLQRLDEELKRRGDLFRKLGVQDVAGYKRSGGTEPMPRTLLLIDEFQEFFVEDDKVAQGASLLLDRIVRQGRAFGIHVILGSQTLGGAYTVARATLGQMVIRIALQCNEADSYLIMDENNSAPRLLSRPGEGIYNDSAGTPEGNSPFQAVWISDEERDAALLKVRRKAAESSRVYPGPFVFEGDAPADLAENEPLRACLAQDRVLPSRSPRVWLGAPNAIKGPTEAILQRQSGNNLLLVGQREEAVLAIVTAAILSLAAQSPAGALRVYLFDAAAPGTPEREYIERLTRALPQQVTLVGNGDAAQVMNELTEELKRRAESTDLAAEPLILTLVHDLQKFKRLRNEEEFSFSTDDSEAPNTGAQFTRLISEGPALGLHVMATCDTYNNVNRCLNRKTLTEFEMRVLFQMSANDSASLIDTPKASTLGLHKAIYYNEQQGYLEVFRPYALPDAGWIDASAARLVRPASPLPGA
ncbi:MAG: ATP-binding protein [Verrucomicrobiales bacterium]|nr:ATP-binding protein [Verrucomicrobiales bacterium]